MADHVLTPSEATAQARLYDVDLLEDPGDVDLYLALAARAGGPILEIAAGSGRIAVPLAEAGYEVTLVDISAAMLARAQMLANHAGPKIRSKMTFVEADLVGLELPGGARFKLAIFAFNSLLIFGTRETQLAALETMARHLVPGGIAVVDVWLPRADELASYDGRLSLEYARTDPETGMMIVKTAAARYEPATGHVDLTVIFEEGAQGAAPVRWVREDRLKLIDAEDLAFLAGLAGLEVELIGGDYGLNPAGPHDDRAILVARRRGGPAPRA